MLYVLVVHTRTSDLHQPMCAELRGSPAIANTVQEDVKAKQKASLAITDYCRTVDGNLLLPDYWFIYFTTKKAVLRACVFFGPILLTQFCVMNPKDSTMDFPAGQPHSMLHQPLPQAGVDGASRSGTQKLSSMTHAFPCRRLRCSQICCSCKCSLLVSSLCTRS